MNTSSSLSGAISPRDCPALRIKLRGPVRTIVGCCLAAVLLGLAGCGTGRSAKKQDDFFTSGSREADQRATQKMIQAEQLSGSGEGSGERGVKKAKVIRSASEEGAPDASNRAAQAEGKLALFERLGGEAGISNIVADFVPRALQDPRVNWQRKGVKHGILSRPNDTPAWNATPQNIENLNRHLAQFLALTTGGPAQYDGKEIKPAHAGMRIGNPEFDATIGDLKASLDKLQIPNKEQKELLAILESTRPLVVTER